MNVLIVEDSHALRASLKDGLGKMGYAVDAVDNGKDGWHYAMAKPYAVIILDLMLPQMDGLEVLRRLRSAGRESHVLILSAKDQVEDRVNGLQLGADDYLVKPFSFDELCARIATLLRRRYHVKNPALIFDELSINTALREVRVKGEAVHLTPGEYAVLEALALNRGHVLSVEQLMDVVYDSDATPTLNVIQVMVCSIRKKLAALGLESPIHTRRGVGYFMK